MVQEQTIELTQQNMKLKTLVERKQKTFTSVITSLSGLIELRDKRVRSHSRIVAEISVGIAKSMNLTKDETEMVLVAALLHDIGKIGIPDVMMLMNESEMSASELKEYRLHPVRGQAALYGVEDLRVAGVLVRHHHENFDGTGYPDGLKGKAIPLGSRIIALADQVDYCLKSSLSPVHLDAVLTRIRDGGDTRFDPAIVPHVRRVAGSILLKMAPDTMAIEMELKPDALKPGLVLSRDVKSGTGVMLLSSGMKLSEKNITALKRIYELDPSQHGIYVLVTNGNKTT
jgi:response regulator RpfG family c-di-GMP phosphodiesterase